MIRILAFAADSIERLLELAHVNKLLYQCTLNKTDYIIPKLLRNEYVSGRYFRLIDCVIHNSERCEWLVLKMMACRSAAPVPEEALAKDVMRHDVNWSGSDYYSRGVSVAHQGYALRLENRRENAWARGMISVRNGRHWFAVQIHINSGCFWIGWTNSRVNTPHTRSVTFDMNSMRFHLNLPTFPLLPKRSTTQTTVGCLLDTYAGTMIVFYNGQYSKLSGCDFLADSEWYPTVCLCSLDDMIVSSSS